MDFGLAGKLGEYYLAQQYRKNGAAGKSNSVNFVELAATKAAEKGNAAGMNLLKPAKQEKQNTLNMSGLPKKTQSS